MRERPTRLSDTARALISDNMQTHGEDMTMLLWSILFLDQDGAKQVSEVLATSPMIARPIGSQDSSLNALLPEAFFTLQDAFAQRTKGMLAIASKTPPDGPALARAFGDLAGTCVACHTTYLYEAPPAEPDSAARATRSR